jgi:hypothetical protein
MGCPAQLQAYHVDHTGEKTGVPGEVFHSEVVQCKLDENHVDEEGTPSEHLADSVQGEVVWPNERASQ